MKNYSSFLLAVMAVIFPLHTQAFDLGRPLVGHALPGESVQISILGGDPSGTVSASVGGQSATVGAFGAGLIEVQIPTNPANGQIEVTNNGVTKLVPGEIEIDRTVGGQVTFPPGVSPAGYLVGTSRDAVALAVDGTFSVRVPRDRASLLWAARDENDSAFATLVLPTDSSALITAESTAKSLLFMLPGYFSIDPVEAATGWSAVEGLAGVADFTEVVRLYSADGVSYFEDIRGKEAVDTAYTVALSAAAAAGGGAPSGDESSSSFKPGQPNGSALRDLNIDFEGSIPSTLPRINTSLKFEAAAPGKVVLNLGNYSGRTNPADWLVRLFEVPTTQFGSFQDIDNLGLKDLIIDEFDEPIQSGLVRASLKSKNGDLIEVVAEKLAALFPLDPIKALGPNQLAIDASYPGIYYSEAVSGNLWYGTEPFFPFILGSSEAFARSQVALLNGSGANRQYYSALAANLIISSFNAMAAAGVKASDYIGESVLAGFITDLFYDVTKAVTTYFALVPEAGSSAFSVKTAGELFQLVYVTVYKSVVSNLGGIAAVSTLGEGLAKTFIKQFDILGRISNGLQAAERVAGVLTPTALAMERSIVVIGNPFDAKITSFQPKFGKTGDFVTIHGFNFGTEVSELSVDFCAFNASQDPSDPLEEFQPQRTIPAEVMSVNKTMATIRVPDGMEGQFLGNLAFLCVERVGTNPTNTRSNREPYRTFAYIPKPALTGIAPSVVRSGEAIIEMQGTNLDPRDGKIFSVSITGPNSPRAQVQGVTDHAVTVQVETMVEGVYQVELRRIDRVIGTASFSVVDPKFAGVAPGQGVIISVQSPSLANSPDNVFTLGEAMLFAAGQLGRAPTSDGDRTDGNPREEDFISVGGNIRRIQYSGPSPVVLPAPLPPLASGWVYEFPTFDGSNLGGSAIGFDVNVDGVTLDAKVQNFGSHGLRLSAGVKNCRFPAVEVHNVGGHGVFLDGDATDNQFFDVKVTQPTGHGLYLKGADVRRNNFRCTLDGVTVNLENPLSQFDASATGYGVLIEDGASVNSVSFDKIRGNQLGGVRIKGAGTQGNVIGWASKVKPTLREISNNGGNGVLIDDKASHNICRWLHLNDNQGDGIRLNNTSFNHVQGIYTGFVEVVGDGGSGPRRYHLASPLAQRNTGAGIRLMNGSAFNTIGSRNNGTFFERGGICNNADSGIILEGPGTDFNLIGKHNIGDLETMGSGQIFATLAEAFVFTGNAPDLSNGLHGVEIRDGASNNQIGSENSTVDLHIAGASNGAGIMVDSSVTPCVNNVIVGNQIGTETGVLIQPGLPKVGIHLKGPCRGTVVGYPGVRLFADVTLLPGDNVSNPFYVFRPYNVIGNCTEAGIRLENVAVPFVNGVPDNPNVIQNNFIGINDGFPVLADFDVVPNLVGIHVTGNSSGNFIGGGVAGEGNHISYNAQYGVLLDSVQQSDPELRDFWRRNEISDVAQGDDYPYFNPADFPLVTVPVGNNDPTAGPVSGIGVLVRDGNPTNIAFGETLPVANEIHDNFIGVYFDETEGGSVKGCLIEDNAFAGVVMSNTGTATLGGGGKGASNLILNNGDGVSDFGGGVLLVGCLETMVSGNRIGVTRRNQDGGNQGNGVVLLNCESVIVGGVSSEDGNVIGFSQENGVLITGNNSSGNRLAFNTIGGDDAGRVYPNGRSGVRVEGGAGHFIGGTWNSVVRGVVQPIVGRNVITRNQDDGVLVEGGGVRVSILSNSIFSNDSDGIALIHDGNDEQVGPLITSIAGSRISGTVPSIGEIPAGSTVQVFAERVGETEGEVLMGATKVKPGGSWTMVLNGPFPFPPTLTMTATHAVTGSTSMFVVDTSIELGMRVRRTDGQAPATQSVEFGPGSLAALAFTVDANNVEVGLDELTFKASGTLDAATAISGAMIYRDADGDGEVGPGDPLVSEPAIFDVAEGEAAVNMDGYRIEANTSVDFLLVCAPNGLVGGGQNFGVSLQSVNEVKAFFFMPPAASAIPATIDFPVESDTFEIQTSGLSTFLTSFFGVGASNPLIGGPFADPDGDSYSNFAEYLLGLDPTVADGHKLVFQPKKSGDQVTLDFTRPSGAVATTFVVESSKGLKLWNDATLSASVVSTTTTDNGDGTETLKVVLDVPDAEAEYYRMQFGR